MRNQYFSKYQGSAIMADREKGQLHDLVGETVNVEAVDFIMTAEYGEGAVFTITSDPKRFYFASGTIRDFLKRTADDGMLEALYDEDVVIEEKVNRKGDKTYIAMRVI